MRVDRRTALVLPTLSRNTGLPQSRRSEHSACPGRADGGLARDSGRFYLAHNYCCRGSFQCTPDNHCTTSAAWLRLLGGCPRMASHLQENLAVSDCFNGTLWFSAVQFRV